MINNKKIGLSLSGGGYRAAAFHLGTLKKLHHLGILEKIDVISTISGGSIVGACYCLNKQHFSSFEKEMYEALNKKSIIRYIVTSPVFICALLGIAGYFLLLSWLTNFLSSWIILPGVLLFVFITSRYQFRVLPLSSLVEKAYNKYFFKNAVLNSLKESPLLVIGTTNLQTFRPFTFSKTKMSDSTYSYLEKPIIFSQENFPLAKAVAASTCVPNFFTPIRIPVKYFKDAAQAISANPVLVDGGIYDNQGIHKLTQEGSTYYCDVIITSDAGNKPSFEKKYSNTLTLLTRTIDAFMARIKHFQMMQTIYSKGSEKRVAYISLAWELDRLVSGFYAGMKSGLIKKTVLDKHRIPGEWLADVASNKDNIISHMNGRINYDQIIKNKLTDTEHLAATSIKTNLTTLSVEQLDAIIKLAGNLTEAQIRLYCPDIIE